MSEDYEMEKGLFVGAVAHAAVRFAKNTGTWEFNVSVVCDVPDAACSPEGATSGPLVRVYLDLGENEDD